MDGLSVAASITGLLQVASKVISFVTTMKDAPSIARNILEEVNALDLIFHQLRDLVSETELPGGIESRKSMIYVDQIVATLTTCVCTFSELEEELEGLRNCTEARGSYGLLDRAKCTQRFPNLYRILENLEKAKSSLNLMLTIYTCKSTRDAQRNMETLMLMMSSILKSNKNISQRMATYYGQPIEDDDKISVQTTMTERSLLKQCSFEFESFLNKTRVYRNASKNHSTQSFISLETAESRWSQLTGMTLSQISNLAVVCLPIDVDELNDPVAWTLPVKHSKPQRCWNAPNYSPLVLEFKSAIFRGDSNTMDRLLRCRITDEDKRALGILLYTTTRLDDLNTARILLKAGADLTVPNNVYRTILEAATYDGNLPLVGMLLEVLESDLRTQNCKFGDALCAAIYCNNLAIARLLLKNGAHVNHCEVDPRGPLWTAAKRGNYDIAKLLIENGADMNIIHRGRSLLSQTIFDAQDSLATLLIQSGVDVNAHGIAFPSALETAAYKKNMALVRLLLQHGAHIHPSGACCNPLWEAASQGATDIVALLIEHGADINATRSNSWTKSMPLYAAAFKGHADTVALLLQKGAIVDLECEHVSTALYAAASQGYTDIAEMLINNGANLNVHGDQGTLLQAAATHAPGKSEVIPLLLHHGLDPNAAYSGENTALYTVTARGKDKLVQQLLDGGADINMSGGLHGTPVQVAMMMKRASTLKILTDHSVGHGKGKNGKQMTLMEKRMSWPVAAAGKLGRRRRITVS